jgi:hypothetical protein
MGRKVLHVVPNKSKGWNVKEGGGEIVSSHRKKDNAVDKTVKIAKHDTPSQVKIHKQNGEIQKEWTYKNDPEKYRG